MNKSHPRYSLSNFYDYEPIKYITLEGFLDGYSPECYENNNEGDGFLSCYICDLKLKYADSVYSEYTDETNSYGNLYTIKCCGKKCSDIHYKLLAAKKTKEMLWDLHLEFQ